MESSVEFIHSNAILNLTFLFFLYIILLIFFNIMKVRGNLIYYVQKWQKRILQEPFTFNYMNN